MNTVCRCCTNSWLYPLVFVAECACRLLTVAVGSLHVVFHVALLGEPDAAHLTLEGLLSSVFDHVDVQSTLLVEGLVALSALEGPLACTETQKCQQMIYYSGVVAISIFMYYKPAVRLIGIRSVVLWYN